ncbi:hypothetical protein FPZ42_11880 [Mucilaginibacter achroorhodeus]|uniref:Outer membrane insertion C-signal n=1 Tax=Mucilaginibacter achroorhodeus TaxID=2599294 RepID=A0A563U0Y6_9SPHI|nr:hypothetical protein [Mucilaginibacter achroorhodeus]TWR25305.1 hypothetical protein FPZ42_11880 [Mucilaginibacter achroorhodeus]
MKKLFLLFAVAFLYFGNSAYAQRGSTSAGLTVDFGDGATLVGPALRHAFTRNDYGQAELTFGGDRTYLAAYYQYQGRIRNSGGLDWYLGIGPQLGFGHGNTDFYIRPMAGLDYKLRGAPLDLSFDWRPAFYVGDNSDFTAARFGLGFRFVF